MGKYNYLIAKDLERIEEDRKKREIYKVMNVHDQQMLEVRNLFWSTIDAFKVLVLLFLGLACYILGLCEIFSSMFQICGGVNIFLTKIVLVLGLTTTSLSVIMIILGRYGLKCYEER